MMGMRCLILRRIVKLFVVLTAIGLVTACGTENASFMDPAGPVADAQKHHLLKVTAWMMVAVLPVFILVPFILWRYRYKNTKASYTPHWEFSLGLDSLMWGVPVVIVFILSVALWRDVAALDPYKTLNKDFPSTRVQVIGLDWKWLFIYPEHNIATVGEMAFPIDRPVSFVLTSDTVMQSFIINSLGGQIYAMPGMQTQLNLKADRLGSFEGENTQYNGDGFTQQKFQAKAMTAAEFQSWVSRVKAEGLPLDQTAYKTLGKRSTNTEAASDLGRPSPDGVIYFTPVMPNLYDNIMHNYHSGTPIPPSLQTGSVSETKVPQNKRSRAERSRLLNVEP